MQVSEFKIGRGEVYAGSNDEFIEIVSVIGDASIGRLIITALHLPDGSRADYLQACTATSFLARYRPATARDFTHPCALIFSEPCDDGECSTCRGIRAHRVATASTRRRFTGDLRD